MDNNVIVVENLKKSYKKADKNAVDGVSFQVKKGELFAFLGPNGAGKTTTISILTTTLAKTSGKVFINKMELDKNQSAIRSKIGIIFQNPSLDPNLTGEENIRFHSVLYGLYSFSPMYRFMSEDYKKKVANLAKLVGLETDIFQPTKKYSGGMKRKLEIIRSMMHSPEILFLDEPTVGLDPESRRNLWEYLEGIRKETGVTMFLTTHYLDEAEDAEHICIINKGKLVADGTPDEIKSSVTGEFIIMKTVPEKMKELQTEIERTGVRYEEENNLFKLYISGGEQAQDIIRNIKVKLTFLDMKRITLEDAYLKIIKEELLT